MTRTIDAIATYTCNHGYRLVGNATRTCLGHKHWSGNPPVCERSTEVHCDILNTPANGHVTYDSETRIVGTIATYQCNVGYTNVAGDQERTCEQNGLWSGLPVSCSQEVHCDSLNSPANGQVTYDSETRIVGTVATYQCNVGYTNVAGDQERTCELNGLWSGLSVSCSQDEACLRNKEEIARQNRGCMKTCTRHNDCLRNRPCVCDGACGLTCIPTDRENYCPALPILGRNFTLTILPESRNFRSIATYWCRRNYERVRGDEVRTCLGNGDWSGSPTLCLPKVVRCPSVQNPLHGQKIGYDYSYDSEVAFRCNLGYILEGANEIRCLTTGSWSAAPPTCREIRCPAPDVRSNVRSDQSLPEYPYQGTMRFYCGNEFELKGPNEITCNSNEQWSNIPPICVVACPEEGLQHGRVEYRPSRPEHGSERIFTCEEGYHQHLRVVESICNAGVWSTNVPVCTEEPCSEDDIGVGQWRVEYNRVSVERGTRPHGTTATFVCTERGHRTNDTKQCLTGQWRGDAPTCTKIPCVRQIIRNGRVHYSTDNPEQGTARNVSCNVGYRATEMEDSVCDVGSWTTALPECFEKPCSEDDIGVGQWRVEYNRVSVERGTRPHGTTATFVCTERGHRTNDTKQCLTGQWRGDAPTCTKIPCVRQNIRNGRVHYSTDNPEQGTARNVSCNVGYRATEMEDSVCDVGSWTTALPECFEKPCSEDDIGVGQWRVEYNRVSVERGTRPHGTTATFVCTERGHRTNDTKQCLTGQWRGDAPTCTKKPCSEDDIGVGQWRVEYNRDSVERRTRPHGTTATFVCTERGHRTSDTKQCLTGQWRGVAPTCTKIPCVHQNIRNGRVHYSTDNPEQGTTRNVSCNRGYRATEIEDSVCDVGSWTTALPECVETTCVVPRRPYYGRWLDNVRDGDTKSDGYGLTYTCNSGYFKCQISQLTCIDGEWMPPPESLCLLGCLIQVTQDAGISVNYSHPDGISCTNSRYKPVRTIRSFTCRRGYRIPERAPGQSTCQANGRRGQSWSSPMPTCEKILCPPIAIQNGRVRYTQYARLILTLEQNTTATFTCNNGYYKSHHNSSSCDLGIWTNEPPRCIEEPCSESSIDFGNWEAVYNTPESEPGSGYRLGGTIATFNCLQYGYATDVQQTCRLGSWDGQRPFCRKIPCEGENLNNGRVEYSSDRVEHGTDRSYICDDGFTLRGNGASTCDAGQWTRELPECVEDPCSENELDGNGWDLRYRPHAQDGYFKSPGTIATLECPHGYENSGRKICQRGSWRGNRLFCNKIACPEEGLQHGRVEYRPSRPEHGSVRIFTCEEGYHRRQPVAESRCNAGVWSTNVPVCTEDPCSEDDIGVGQWRVEYNRDSVERGTRPHGTTATFVCTERGHRTSDTKQCLTGQWRGDAPTCTKILCPPIAIQNRRVRYTLDARLILTLEQNTTATFTCNNGYYKSHHNSSSCDLGIWTNEPPRCIEEPCSESSIDFGYWEAVYNTPESEPGSGYRLGGTIATFNCLQYGYATDVQQTCRLGSWDGQRPFCRKIPCEGEYLNNGRVEYSSGRVEHGTDRSYICDDGFTLRGNGASTCDAGQWTRELPECIEDPCSENDLDGNGWDLRYRPHAQDGYFKSPGTIATLECPHGYENSGEKICQRGSWRGNRLSCNKIACPEEGLQHGRVEYRPSRPEHGSVRIFTCEEGYHQRQPVAESRCNAGVWSTNFPVCTEEPCSEDDIGVGQWRVVYNRDSVERGTRPHGTTATFVCTERGHRTSGTKQCRTGQWRGDAPTCTKIPCVHQKIRNGRVHYSTDNPEQGTTRNVACKAGYRATDMEDSVCDLGSWTTALPECDEISCSKEEFPNGWFVYYDHNNQRTTNPEHGSRLQAVCEPGTHFIDDVVLHTSRCWNGQWEQEVPECIADPCPPLVNHPDYLAVTYSEKSDGSHYPHSTLATFHCVEGFVLANVNEEQRTCRRGEWRGPNTYPRCAIEPCSEYDIGVGQWRAEYNRVSVERGTRPHGTTATFVCTERGHRTSDTKQCLNGRWRGDSPTCTKIPCVHQNIRNGRVHYSTDNPEQGTTRNVACKAGYRATEMEDSVCDLGSWTTALPKCVENPCRPLVNHPHYMAVTYRVESDGSDNLHSTLATFHCVEEGFVLENVNGEQHKCRKGEWRGPNTYPRCKIEPCSEDDVGVGQWRVEYNRVSVERGTRPHGTTATFVCTERGHRTSDTKQCLNGQWRGDAPTCTKIPCVHQNIRNGRGHYSTDNPEQGTIRNVACKVGYRATEMEDSVRDLGSWTTALPRCVENPCPRLVNHPDYLAVTYSEESDGSHYPPFTLATFHCVEEGFVLENVNDEQRTCRKGEWRGPNTYPRCTIKPCNEDDIGVGQWRVEYNRVSVERGTRPHGTTATFVCTERGHRTSDTKQCLNGQWRGDAPTCTKILCPPIAIQNGRVRYTLDARLILTLEQNTTATFTCNNGYYKSHHNSSSCDLGIWTNEPPRCIEEPCSESSIDFGYWEAVYNTPESEPGSGYRLGGTIATFNCLQYGYATDVQQTCRLGSWDGQRPFCRKIPCEGENLNNGRVEYSSDRVEHGTDRSYICDDGFTLRGNGASTCDAGQWTRELPECVEDPCSENELDGNGWDLRYRPHAQDRYFKSPGTIATLECPHGYENSGEKICQRGSWRGNTLSCNKIACPEEGLQHGRVEYRPSRPEHGSVRIFTCEEGYHQRQPVAESRCNAGVWSTNVPVCTEDPCSEDDIGVGQWRVEYNRDSVERGTRPHGTTATFVCTERGHRTSDTKQCLTGQWRGDAPTCTKITCFHQNIRNGRVLYSTDNPEQGTTRNVTCNGGYQTTEIEDSVCDLGVWTTALPKCVEKSCNKWDLQSSEWNIEVSIEDGNNADIIHLPGTVAIVTCNDFGFLDTPTRGGRKTCSFGEWQGVVLLCERVSCSREEFSNGRFVYYDHNNNRTENPQHGGRLQAVCASGTHFIDGEVVHTSRCWNGQWEQEVPSCVGDPCPPLVNHPDNLAVTYSEESVGSHYPHSTLATFHCVEEGFVLENVNEEQRTCRKGEWRGPSTYPRCTIAICEVRLVDNGNVHYMNNTVITRPPRHGDRVTVTCNDGFNISDVVESITCVNGVWNRILPTCVEAKCLAVSSMDYFTIFYGGASSRENEFDPGTELEVSCRDGLFPDRTESSICRNGQWSPSIPRCTSAANCQPVLDEEGREIEYFDDRSYVHGSNLTVSCDHDDDTVLIGSMTSRCDNGTWNPPVGKCLVNVAKNKRAYQGSKAYGDSGADLAVNGLTVENGRCSQTRTTNQWWFVDLGANFTVREIQIYHHDDQNTLLNAEVRVGQEAGSEITQNTLVGRVTDVSSNPVRITVNENVEGRFVSVDHTGSSDPLVLCEVQIFGDLLGDPCDNGCVVPRSLANGRYGAPIRSEINYRTIDPGSCFRDNIHLSVLCNPDNSLIGSHYYTCDQNTGKFDYRNTGHREMLSYCGSSCPRPQINLNVLYFVGENNDPIGDRTAFNQAEEIYSKCEDPRYQLHVGHNRRRCQRGLTWTQGVWTGSAPRCDISQLHMDISPKTSLTISPSGQFVLVIPMDEVTISCRNRFNGAQLSGDTRIRKDGEDTHGERSDDTSVFRLVIINPTAEDSGIYTCLSSGLSHSISVAFEETPVCSSPATNPHVAVLVGENNLPIASRVSFSEGERLTFWCEGDMTLVGANSIECIEGQWTGRTPTCAVRCPALTTPVNGRKDGFGTGYNDRVAFTCDQGFSLNGESVLTCQSDGTWSADVPECTAVQCPALTTPVNGRKDGFGTGYNDRVEFTCDQGFSLNGESVLTCQSDGTWSADVPVCTEDNRCSRPDIFPNIIAHVGVGEDITAIGNHESFMRGETITFRCEDVRYQTLVGPIHRQCIDGEWTERAPRCETSQLQVSVDNTILKTVSPDGTFIVYPIRGWIFINCKLRTGARIANSATLTTNSTTQPSQRAYIAGKSKYLALRNPTSGNDGTYTCETRPLRHSIRIKFKDIRCPAPGNVLNGMWAYVRASGNKLNPHAYILSEMVTVQCNPGYHASSNQESRCNYQGQWSPPLSSCIAD
ncbi:uncharacterized protein [Apostichopus japonicus]|uniref:uncharacterized protein isoform X6 n=1 Tax=Stichopus japonicus TaxID=307972 RepID=UPI003AB421B3